MIIPIRSLKIKPSVNWDPSFVFIEIQQLAATENLVADQY